MENAPATDRGRASRQRIVEAAADLFYRRGVGATGLAEVITASGTGKGQLYHYFTDKPDLVLAVIHTQADRTMQAQHPVIASMTTADDLRRWVDEAVAAHEGGDPVRCPLGALAVELGARRPDLRASLDAAFGRWRTALACALERLRRTGHVRNDRDPGDLAEILLCAYEGGVVLSEVHGHTRSLRIALDAAVDSMLGPQPS